MPEIPTTNRRAQFLPTTGPNEAAATVETVRNLTQVAIAVEQTLYADRIRQQSERAALQINKVMNDLSLSAKSASNSETVVSDFVEGFEKANSQIRAGIKDKTALSAYDNKVSENFQTRMLNVQTHRIVLHRQESVATHMGIVKEAQRSVMIDHSSASRLSAYGTITDSWNGLLQMGAISADEHRRGIDNDLSSVAYSIAADMLNHNQFEQLRTILDAGDLDALNPDARLDVEQALQAKRQAKIHNDFDFKITVEGLGSLELIQEMQISFEAGDLTASALRNLTAKVMSQMRAKAKDAGELALYDAGKRGDITLSPGNPKHRGAVDAGFERHWNETLGNEPPERQIAGAIAFSVDERMIPKGFRDQMFSAAANPEQNPVLATQLAFAYNELTQGVQGLLLKKLPEPYNERMIRMNSYKSLTADQAVRRTLEFEIDRAAPAQGDISHGQVYDELPEEEQWALSGGDKLYLDEGQIHPDIPLSPREHADRRLRDAYYDPEVFGDTEFGTRAAAAIGTLAFKAKQVQEYVNRESFEIPGIDLPGFPDPPSQHMKMPEKMIGDINRCVRAAYVQNRGMMDDTAQQMCANAIKTTWGVTTLFGPSRWAENTIEMHTNPKPDERGNLSWEWAEIQFQKDWSLYMTPYREVDQAFPDSKELLADSVGKWVDNLHEKGLLHSMTVYPARSIYEAVVPAEANLPFTDPNPEGREVLVESIVFSIINAVDDLVFDDQYDRSEIRNIGWKVLGYNAFANGALVSDTTQRRGRGYQRRTHQTHAVVQLIPDRLTPTGNIPGTDRRAPGYTVLLLTEDGEYKAATDVYPHLRFDTSMNRWYADEVRYDEEMLQHPDQTGVVVYWAERDVLERLKTMREAAKETTRSFHLPGFDPSRLTPEEYKAKIDEMMRLMPRSQFATPGAGNAGPIRNALGAGGS